MIMSQETSTPAIVAPQVLLNNHLKALKLPTFAREYEKVAMESAQDRADYPRYLLRLCELERIDRERRNVERRIRLAHFPQTKSFDTFDFAAQPSLNKALVRWASVHTRTARGRGWRAYGAIGATPPA